MKNLFFIFFIFPSLSPGAQNLQTYTDLLKFTEEVYVSDSLHINAAPRQRNLLDSMSVKKWFSPVLGTTRNNRIKNRNYYMAGKITINANFDLLVLSLLFFSSSSTSKSKLVLVVIFPAM